MPRFIEVPARHSNATDNIPFRPNLLAIDAISSVSLYTGTRSRVVLKSRILVDSTKTINEVLIIDLPYEVLAEQIKQAATN